MNMPGFTAEASLGSITRVYRAAASIVSKTDEVQMQTLFFCLGELLDHCCRCDDDGYNCRCFRLPLPELFPVFPEPAFPGWPYPSG
jgi:hypothetical protein